MSERAHKTLKRLIASVMLAILAGFGSAAVQALALLSTLAAPESAQAGPPLYRYTDEDGTVHFTNVPTQRRYHRVFLTRRGIVRDGAGRRRPGRPPEHSGYDRLIASASAAYGLEPALVKAVIAAESNFDARAVSRRGAQGLMQLMPHTARGLGVGDPLSPTDNVLGGTRYLRQMIDRYGDLSRALAAYNAGPTAVDRYDGVPPYEETQAYVTRVLHYYRGYDSDFRSRRPTP